MRQLKFISENLIVRCRSCVLQFLKQCVELVNSHFFPLLQIGDALLQKDVFLPILDIFVVELSSQHTFLLFQNVELSTDDHELFFQQAVLLCKLKIPLPGKVTPAIRSS